jgi:hypothetical protein
MTMNRRARLILLLAVTACLQACASVARPTPVLQPVQPVPLLLGMNDGGHTGVPGRIVDRYCAANREFVIRAAVLSVDEATAVLDSLKPCARLHGLLLVEKKNLPLVEALSGLSRTRADIWGFELMNEPDLAGLSPAEFGGFIGAGYAVLRGAGYTGHIVIGGIYTVDNHQPQDFEEYLRPALAVCPDCIVALHWYGSTSNEWLARVQALGFPVAVTEFGVPACTPAQEVAQFAYFREQLAAYARTGNVLLAIPYQRLSAPAPCDDSDASHLAHFGLERPDGTLKPAAALFFTGGTP